MDTDGLRTFHPTCTSNTGIFTSLVDLPPADYILKIESFSLFLETKVENYESRVFEAGGCKWKLCLCPQGNKKVGVNDHISLYLKLMQSEGLPQGWQVYAKFKFFVFDHNRGKFLMIQDGEELNRFDEFKSEWGYDRLLPLETFKDEKNGYLWNDCCVFGAEIYVRGDKRKGECVSTVKNPDKGTYTWKIENFSTIQTENVFSDEFVVGDQNWKLFYKPRGSGSGKGTHLSLYIYSSTSNVNNRVYAEFKFRIKDQIRGKNHESTDSFWFCSTSIGTGFPKFLSLKDLKDKSKGYIVNDTVILEAEISLLSFAKDY